MTDGYLTPWRAVQLLYFCCAVGVPFFHAVDECELNTCFNPDTGEKRFTQAIYWSHVDSSKPGVIDWHMADKVQSIAYVSGREYPWTIIRQKDCGQVQIIRAKRLRVTYTFNDPEEDHQWVLPVEQRPGLK